MATTSLTIAGAQYLLNLLFSAATPAPLWLGAFVGVPGVSPGAAEGWSGYQRVPLAAAAWSGPTLVGNTQGMTYNAVAIVAPPGTGTVVVQGIGLWAAAYGGDPLAVCTLSPGVTLSVTAGGLTLVPGALQVSLSQSGGLTPAYAANLALALVGGAWTRPVLSALLLRSAYGPDQGYAYVGSTIPINYPRYEVAYPGYARIPANNFVTPSATFPAQVITAADLRWPTPGQTVSLAGWGLVDAADVLVLAGSLAGNNGQTVTAGDQIVLPAGSLVLEIG